MKRVSASHIHIRSHITSIVATVAAITLIMQMLLPGTIRAMASDSGEASQVSAETAADGATEADVDVAATASDGATGKAANTSSDSPSLVASATARGALMLTTKAAWVDETHADENYDAVETLTVSGIAAAEDAPETTTASAPDSIITVSQVIGADWAIDTKALEESIETERAKRADEGIGESYEIVWVTYDDSGMLQPANKDTDGAFVRITYTLDFAKATADSATVTLPLTLSESGRSHVGSYVPLADDPNATDDPTIAATTTSENATTDTSGISATRGTATVYAASPELQVTEAIAKPAEPALDPVESLMIAASPALIASPDFGDLNAQSVNSGQQGGFQVKGYALVNVTDGTATFDSDDAVGNDSGGTNARARSNDSIIYKTSYALQTVSGDAAGEGYYLGTTRIQLTATMPDDLYTASDGTAYWDTSAMQWLESAQISADGKTVTGYMTFDGTALSNPLAPRVGAMNWVLNAGWAVDGTAVATPTFTFTPEGHATTTATINHAASANANMDSVTVTAKGRYNTQLEYESDDLYSVTLQFYNANGGLKGQELPDENTPITVTLATNWNQTYKDAKLNITGVTGEKGIITAGQYGTNAPWDDGATTLATAFNTVYDGGTVSGLGTNNPNSSIDLGNTITLTISDFAIDMTDTTGFRAGSGLVYPDRNASATSAQQSANYDDNTTYNFGAYLFKVATPSDYPITGGTTIGTVKIDSATFTQIDGATSGDVLADDNTCNLTLGEYPYISGLTINHMGVVNSSQSTSYDYSRRAGLNNYGIFKLNDDGTKTQVNATASDTYTTVDMGDRIVIDTGEWFGFHPYDVGTDSAGIKVCNASNNIPRYGTLFEKFDGHVFDVDETSSEAAYAYFSYIGDYAFKQVNVAFKYVAKEGGWTDEAEQYSAHLDADADGRYQDVAPAGSGLVVYDSIADVRTAQASDTGLEIVGIVADIYIPQTVTEHITANAVKTQGDRGAFSVHYPTLKVKDTAATDPTSGAAITDKGDARLVAVTSSDGTLRTVSSSTSSAVNHTYRNWTAAGTTNTGGPQDIRRTSYDTTSAYTKADFDSTGTLVGAPVSYNSMIEGAGTYRNFSNMSGFSYYVQLYMPYVTKGVAQSDGQTEKSGYNIDEGQRRADFQIRSGITGSKTFGSGDTLTIADTIPVGVYPVDTTSSDVATRWGITYANANSTYQDDSSTNGGAGGSWSNDSNVIENTDVWKAATTYADENNLTEPTCTLAESTDASGNVVLIWTILNWPVGYAMPDIHYSGVLGTPDDPFTDLVNGDSLTNTATVTTTTLPNTATAEKTVTVFRQDAATAVKTSVDADDEEYADNLRPDLSCPVAFDIEFDNEVEKQANDDISIIDVFETGAAGNLEGGYTDPGDFVLANATFEGLNLSGCSLKFYYATEASIAAAGTTSAALYADQQSLASASKAYNFGAHTAWKKVDITINTDGTVSAASAAAVKAALEGQQVRAVGFSAGNLKVGSRWKLHYDYRWTDATVSTAMHKTGSFKNSFAFYVNSTKQSGTTSAISLPPAPKPATYNPSVTKVITGDKPASASTFTFTLAATAGATPMPNGAFGGTATTTTSGTGTSPFGSITYTTPGTYTYRVTENAGSGADGYTYDTTVYTLIVTVTMGDDNQLVAAATISSDAPVTTTGATVASGVASPMVAASTAAGVLIAATFTNRYTKPDVTVVKTPDKTEVASGETIAYTLTVKNSGTSTANGIFVKDYVPDNTTYISSTGSGARYGATAAGSEYVTWWIPTLAPGATETLTMTVQVEECSLDAVIRNTALVSTDNTVRPSSGTDPDPNGNGYSNTTSVRVTDSPTLTSAPPMRQMAKTGDVFMGSVEFLTMLSLMAIIAIAAGLYAGRQKKKGTHSE